MKKFKSLKKIDKPREKLLKKGVESLKEVELVSIIIGSGVKGRDLFFISEKVLKSIKKAGKPKTEELLKIEGLGIAKASKIVASYEFFKRLFTETSEITIKKAEDVYTLVFDLRDKKQEHFILFTLDGANRVINKRTLFVGTLTQSIVHPREIFAYALEDRAASIIIVHNHPSGNLEASEDDIRITERVREAGKLMGIELLDHIIVSKNGYKSILSG